MPVAAIAIVLIAVECEAEEISFNRHVRPILSDRCFHCHGPDSVNQDSDLRLDDPMLALADLGGYAAIVPGYLSASELHHRIRSTGDDQMPPLGSNRTLTEDEKDILDKWILAGAEYERHWSFEDLPERVALPAVDWSDWPRLPFDTFILATLKQKNLQPSDEAPPLRWLRRVTFDLTGLPPSSEEVRAFVATVGRDGEAAYQSKVDALLASAEYGEHMAVAWLDAARYADSYGYQSDKLNTQWPYRDWVVRAFNENLPYDEFLTWQLAGDLLDTPTTDQRLATAFNRIHRLNNEGGAIFEEWRLENVADRVHTFGTAILGLTLECCRCHDHKYDPISTRDYYAISAFFNSIDENGLYDRTEKVPSPSLLLPTAEQSKQLEHAKEQFAAAKVAHEHARRSAEQRYQQWKRSDSQGPIDIPDLLIALGFDDSDRQPQSDQYFFSTNDRSKTSSLDFVKVEDSSLPALQSTDEEARQAIALDGDRGVTIKGIAPFDRWTPFSVVISMRETKRHPQRSVIAHHSRGTDAGYNGWDLTITDGHVESRMYRVWPGNAIGVRTKQPIPADQWLQLTATYDGLSTADSLRLYVNGEQLKTITLRNKVVKQANVHVDHGGEMVIGQRFRSRGFDGGLIDDVRIYGRALTGAELQHLGGSQSIEPMAEYFASAVDDACRRTYEQLLAAQEAIVMAEEAMQEVPIMEETGEPRVTHVLARGQYDAPTNDQTRVERNTFEKILPNFPTDAPRNRLGLAQWVTSSKHPLTSRVIVNRIWDNFFGAGLVRTPENFGLQGELPTHPQLLDWLARDLIDSGWDIKRLCKNIVLSATYRQESKATPEMLSVDPENRLLGRGPAYRLSAEQIRDLALSASGLLNRKQGGPPVSPYQAGGDLWKESNIMSPSYVQSVGEEVYRRSLYSVWKRTAPLPNMMAFDSTSREVCTVSRSRTNTPLQALVLLNDVQFIESARILAERVITQSKLDDERIRAAFVALTGREPDTWEKELLGKLLLEERTYYRANPKAAEQLLESGDSARSGAIATDELASMTIVCQAILNLDATVWKR
ncbi:MAG: DUF1553 domain-containing protein [Planctomycetota bacterium]